MRVMGVDPSLVRTGWCVLDDGQLVAHGFITTLAREDMARRLYHINRMIYTALLTWQPEYVAIESSEDFQRRLKDGKHSVESLAAARSAVLIACADLGIEAKLLNPGHVRWSVCGNLKADKLQVVAALRAHGYELPLMRNGAVDLDVADAVSTAKCCWSEMRLLVRVWQPPTTASEQTSMRRKNGATDADG